MLERPSDAICCICSYLWQNGRTAPTSYSPVAWPPRSCELPPHTWDFTGSPQVVRIAVTIPLLQIRKLSPVRVSHFGFFWYWSGLLLVTQCPLHLHCRKHSSPYHEDLSISVLVTIRGWLDERDVIGKQWRFSPFLQSLREAGAPRVPFSTYTICW